MPPVTVYWPGTCKQYEIRLYYYANFSCDNVHFHTQTLHDLMRTTISSGCTFVFNLITFTIYSNTWLRLPCPQLISSYQTSSQLGACRDNDITFYWFLNDCQPLAVQAVERNQCIRWDQPDLSASLWNSTDDTPVLFCLAWRGHVYVAIQGAMERWGRKYMSRCFFLSKQTRLLCIFGCAFSLGKLLAKWGAYWVILVHAFIAAMARHGHGAGFRILLLGQRQNDIHRHRVAFHFDHSFMKVAMQDHSRASKWCVWSVIIQDKSVNM